MNLIIELFEIDFKDITKKMYHKKKYKTKILKICNAINKENKF